MRHEGDVNLAARVAAELRSGRSEGVVELYRRLHPVVLGYATARLRDPDLAEEVVASLWAHVVEGGVLERYAGRASLRSYLLSIAEYLVRDAIKARDRSVYVEPGEEIRVVGPHDRAVMAAERAGVIRRVVGEALVELSREHPRCALVLWMRAAGLQYRDIARVELAAEGAGSEPPEADVRRRTNALKKLATRKDPPGCEARMRRILEGLFRKRGLRTSELLD